MIPTTPTFSLPVLLMLILLTLLALMISVVLSFTFLGKNKPKRGNGLQTVLLAFSYLLTVVCLVMSVFYVGSNTKTPPTLSTDPTFTKPTAGPTDPTQTDPTAQPTNPTTQPTTQPTEPTPPPTIPTEPKPTLGNVGMTDQSNPANWGVKWDIFQDGQLVNFFEREEEITFGDPNETPYFAFPGIATFRGNNYRTGSAYGYVDMVEQKLTTVWNRKISSMPKGSASGVWTGCGWTGQPLVVQWDDATKQIMNLYPEKKAKEGLIEVIYATMDGHIYFYDLEDGTYTRDPLKMGMAFKGAGALDPRGYPIMYVGSGDTTNTGKVPRMYIISLIDTTIMYEYGNKDSDKKRNWTAYDSSPLVDPETDTLIWPGESGVLYTMKLNTNYDKEAGTLSIAPSNLVKTRYTTTTGGTYGYEASSIMVENYLYVCDNGGMLYCVDINTMELIWAQYTKDDNNATPVFEWGEDGKGYLYLGTSMEYCDGFVYIYKIDAATGEIVWEVEFDNVYFNKDVSGGILSSPVLGKKGTELEGLIIYTIAKTPGAYNGIMVAMDTDTGEIVWKRSLNHYAWSSPVAVYNEEGKANLILCDSGGYVHLINIKNGTTIMKVGIGANVEATPAIFNDMLVVGTRGQQVYGIKLS